MVNGDRKKERNSETERDRNKQGGRREEEQGTIWVSASNAGIDAERRRGSVTRRRNCYGMAVS